MSSQSLLLRRQAPVAPRHGWLKILLLLPIALLLWVLSGYFSSPSKKQETSTAHFSADSSFEHGSSGIPGLRKTGGGLKDVDLTRALDSNHDTPVHGSMAEYDPRREFFHAPATSGRDLRRLEDELEEIVDAAGGAIRASNNSLPFLYARYRGKLSDKDDAIKSSRDRDRADKSPREQNHRDRPSFFQGNRMPSDEVAGEEPTQAQAEEETKKEDEYEFIDAPYGYEVAYHMGYGLKPREYSSEDILSLIAGPAENVANYKQPVQSKVLSLGAEGRLEVFTGGNGTYIVDRPGADIELSGYIGTHFRNFTKAMIFVKDGSQSQYIPFGQYVTSGQIPIYLDLAERGLKRATHVLIQDAVPASDEIRRTGQYDLYGFYIDSLKLINMGRLKSTT